MKHWPGVAWSLHWPGVPWSLRGRSEGAMVTYWCQRAPAGAVKSWDRGAGSRLALALGLGGQWVTHEWGLMFSWICCNQPSPPATTHQGPHCRLGELGDAVSLTVTGGRPRCPPGSVWPRALGLRVPPCQPRFLEASARAVCPGARGCRRQGFLVWRCPLPACLQPPVPKPSYQSPGPRAEAEVAGRSAPRPGPHPHPAVC